jgi:carbon storage regulator
MLVLSRGPDESIVINNTVVITVVDVRGNKVRLGIIAPKDIPVHRQEVYDGIHGPGATRSLIWGGNAPRGMEPMSR